MVLASSLISLFVMVPPADALLERPHGAVMGDGLRLQSNTGPVGGGICADGQTVFGIDVSYWQGAVDWDAVAADGVEYAFVRVSHSTQFFDPEFDTNLAGSRAAGIRTGVYQYFEPDEDPIAQADLLLDAMGPLQPGDLPPVIDVESTAGLSPSQVTAAVREWVDYVEAELGVAPIIYTGYYFWQDNVSSADFGGYPLWIAWYGVECPSNVPTGWSQWAFHQYCDCGTVDGVSGDVDVNRFNGSIADLDALGAAPGECGFVGADGVVLDNGDDCYTLYGNPDFWREEPTGEGGSLVWTNATDNAEPSNYARWDLHFEASGSYEIQVHVAQPFGESTRAAYVVSHAEGEDTVLVDQSANEGWVSLGEFVFEAGAAHSIQLGDNTGEPNDGEVSIVFDAISLERIDNGTSGTTGEPGGESSGGDDTGEVAETSGTSGASGNDETSESGSESDGGPALPGSTDDGGGCGCRSSSSGEGAGWLLLGLLGAIRRRRSNG